MKNTTKAAVAGGVGVALLLGGAGTIAYWTDTQAGAAATVQSGNLELGTPGGPGWQLRHVGDNPEADPAWVSYEAGDRIVPGDQLRMTQSVPVELAGKAIAADFAGSVEVAATGTEATALAAALGEPTLSVESLSGATGSLALDPESNTMRGEGEGTMNVITTLDFPWGTEGQYNPAKLASLDLTVNYTLTQVPGTPEV